MKVLYLVAAARRPNRENLTGRISNWKQALNILTIHYDDRLDATQWIEDHNQQAIYTEKLTVTRRRSGSF